MNHSKNVLPVFVSATDLHLNATNASNLSNLAGAGTPLTGVTIDIDGAARAALPTIGAHELATASCPAPNGLTVTGITTTSAILNWTQPGTPTQWQVKSGPAGFPVSTGGTSVFTSTKPYTLNPPLTMATAYEVLCACDLRTGRHQRMVGSYAFYNIMQCTGYPDLYR